MKSTGIVRKIDELGRFVIPKEIRKALGLVEDQAVLEIFVDEDRIIMKKYEPQQCIFCGQTHDLTSYRDKLVCRTCIRNFPKD